MSDRENTDLSKGGVKYDQGKTRLDLFPPDALFAISEVLTFGANKYKDRNWEAGMNWSRPFGALMRHMWAWWKGEGHDPETGMSHLWHAGCCIIFLIAYEMRGIGADDRHILAPTAAPGSAKDKSGAESEAN